MSQNIYRTSNLYLAAGMIARGARLSSVEDNDPRHQVFCLMGSMDFDQLEIEWYENRMTGNLIKFRDAILLLKSKLYE